MINFDIEELNIGSNSILSTISSIKCGQPKIVVETPGEKIVVLTLKDMDNIMGVLEMWNNGNMQALIMEKADSCTGDIIVVNLS